MQTTNVSKKPNRNSADASARGGYSSGKNYFSESIKKRTGKKVRYDAFTLFMASIDMGDMAWAQELEYHSDGAVKDSISNTMLVLRNDPDLAGIKIDRFGVVSQTADFPWRRFFKIVPEMHTFMPGDYHFLRQYLSRYYQLTRFVPWCWQQFKREQAISAPVSNGEDNRTKLYKSRLTDS